MESPSGGHSISSDSLPAIKDKERSEYKARFVKANLKMRNFQSFKISCNKILTVLFPGGQEHLEQVQRGGGEATAHLGGAGLRLCIRDHFKLSSYVSHLGHVSQEGYVDDI